MGSRVEFAVSLTPITTIPAVSGVSAATDVIEADINKSLGGSGAIAITGTVDGYQLGQVYYKSAPVNDDPPTTYSQLGSDNTQYKMVYIKNTGRVFSTQYVLGVPTTDDIVVIIETSGAFATTCNFLLPAGAAIMIPGLSLPGSCGIWVTSSSGVAGHTVAVEYALIT